MQAASTGISAGPNNWSFAPPAHDSVIGVVYGIFDLLSWSVLVLLLDRLGLLVPCDTSKVY